MSEFNMQDEKVLEALGRGLEQSDPVPEDVIEFAKASYTWRDIDAELAELEFDSVDQEAPNGVRSSATARLISFQAGQWMLDIEFDPTSGRLMGAISPQTRYTVDVHSAGGFFTTESDDLGRFQAEGVVSGPLSMVLRFEGGQTIKTQWVVL
ncbi:MAG TPA: hypothetical protein VFO17_03545 [Acidimicrobiia bacterium]|jgi:hypothetical protein|nr:hypothetical protein [Acidimicrobiia bacterium]